MSDFANTVFLRDFYLVIFFFFFSLNEQTEKEIWKPYLSHSCYVTYLTIWDGGKNDSLVAVSGYTPLSYPGWSNDKMCIS